MADTKPPPIGLVPRRQHERNRVNKIFKAMCRYSQAGKPIPMEWITELRDYVSWFAGPE